MAGDDERFKFHVLQADFFKPGQSRLHAARYAHAVDAEAHDHDLFEIALVVSGRCVHVSAEGEQSLSAGDVVLLRPGAWHSLTKPESFVVFNCLFSPSLLAGPLAWALEDESLHLLLNVAPVQANRRGVLMMRLAPDAIERCVALMDRIGARSSPEYAATGALLQLLAELAGGLAETTRSQPIEATRDVHPAIHKAIRAMAADPAKHWTINELAGLAGLTGPYLVRRFTADVGMSPLRYLARLRAERAAMALIRTDKPITQIGLDVGWDESHHFARRFKEHFGLTATEYRRRFAAGRSNASGATNP